jgi:hypothetical protein
MTIKSSLCLSFTFGAIAFGLCVASPGALAASGPTAAPGPGQTLAFSGYDWAVKAPATTFGPGPNYWSAANVDVDALGRLHLRITYRGGRWYCGEVALDEELGYGTYRFSVASPIGDLDPNVTLGMFTYSDDPAENHREIDIEIARWGSATDPTNAQYVVQPAGPAGHLTRFTQPAWPPRSEQSITWLPGQVDFASSSADGSPIARTTYHGGDVPTPGSERVHINLWLYAGLAPTNGAGVEVTLSSFSFTPATPSQLAAALTAANIFGVGPLATLGGGPAPSSATRAELGI